VNDCGEFKELLVPVVEKQRELEEHAYCETT
jgi:hypothetical protein